MRVSEASTFVTKASQLLGDFAALGALYRVQFRNQAWKRFPDRQHCPWDGIGLFLWGYASERQGRRPDFPTAARG